MKRDATARQDRLLKAALLGAGVVTLTWWTLLACGVWRAIEWVAA